MADVTTEAPKFSNETNGVNVIPFALMAAGWVAPLLMFWLYVWGPLRPFHYPKGDLAPPLPLFLLSFAVCLGPWWLPASYYRVQRLERSGRLYESLGVRMFRRFVPDGDFANWWRRRRQPGFRIIRNRTFAAAFVARTELSERSHLVLLLAGVATSAFAWQIGWNGWAAYLGIGNVVVHVYPILLQRYTRARIQQTLARGRRPAEK